MHPGAPVNPVKCKEKRTGNYPSGLCCSLTTSLSPSAGTSSVACSTYAPHRPHQNGYLLDQFINSNSNKRNDPYGGTYQNRARLLLAVVQAVAQEIGAERVGVRLTPMGRFMGMGDDTPIETFTYIVESLNRYGLAYLHLVEPAVVGTVKDENFDPRWDEIILKLRDAWNGVLIIAGGYDAASAEKAIREGRADVVAFGRPFLANPDLPRRIRDGFELNTPDPTTFFGGDERGYIDYPVHA